jgi:hypothetical protein
MMFAVGRNIQYCDQPSIRAIARESARENYTFASQLMGLVQSVPFQNGITRVSEQ